MFKDFLSFLREQKKWWLVPVLIVLVVLGALLLFAQSSPLSPFMYSGPH
jgi:competence protein ComGC